MRKELGKNLMKACETASDALKSLNCTLKGIENNLEFGADGITDKRVLEMEFLTAKLSAALRNTIVARKFNLKVEELNREGFDSTGLV